MVEQITFKLPSDGAVAVSREYITITKKYMLGTLSERTDSLTLTRDEFASVIESVAQAHSTFAQLTKGKR